MIRLYAVSEAEAVAAATWFMRGAPHERVEHIERSVGAAPGWRVYFRRPTLTIYVEQTVSSLDVPEEDRLPRPPPHDERLPFDERLPPDTASRALRVLIQRVRFERAEFGHLHPTADDALPTTEKEVTEFIRRRTRLYMESWVVPALEELVTRAEGAPVAPGDRVIEEMR